MELLPVIIVVCLAMGFNYTNGFHDAANAIATSVSTRALTPRAAMMPVASICLYWAGMALNDYDALLVLSFGGPEGEDEVIPFLENVTRGRGIPRERLEAVAEHYHHFGGVSPINRLNLDMIDALRGEGHPRQTNLRG